VSVVRKMKRRRMRSKPVCLSILVPLIYIGKERNSKPTKKGRWRMLFRRFGGDTGDAPEMVEDRGTGLATF